MDFWNIVSYIAWVAAAALFLWIVVDMVKVNSAYDESYLLSSREGEDILLEGKADE